MFAVKEILVHSTMEMVQRYMHLEGVDIEEALGRRVQCTVGI